MIPPEVIRENAQLGNVVSLHPEQSNAVQSGAVPVGAPEGQQEPAAALRNQLDTVVGDLRIAQGRIGQIPVHGMVRDTVTGLSTQYSNLMDTGRQLYERLDARRDAYGEDLGLSQDINRLQGDVEMFVGSVESELERSTMEAQQHPAAAIASQAMTPANGNGNGQAANGGAAMTMTAPNRNWMRWGAVIGGLILVVGGGYYWYSRRGGVTPAG